MAYDEKMNFYTNVAEDMGIQELEAEVDFALLHMGPLANALQVNARGWVTSLGKLLNESAKENLMKLDQEITVGSYMYIIISIYCFISFLGSIKRIDSIS